MEMLKEGHEAEMEPLTRDIDRLQVGMMAMRMMITMTAMMITMTMVTMLMLMMILKKRQRWNLLPGTLTDCR